MNKQSNNKVTKEEQIKFLVDNGYEPNDYIVSATRLGDVDLADLLHGTFYEVSKEEIKNYINQQKQKSTKEEQVQNNITNNNDSADSVGSTENQKNSWYELGQRPPVGETVILCREGYRDIPVKIKAFSDTIFIYELQDELNDGEECTHFIKGCSFKPLPVKTKDEQTIDEISKMIDHVIGREYVSYRLATEIFNKFIKAPKD